MDESHISATFRPARLAKASCDACGEARAVVMVLRARDKQITFCARCIAILDAAYNLSEEIAYYAQLEGESDE